MCHRHDTENDNKNEQNNNRKAKNKGSFGRYVPSNRFISLLYDFFKFFIYRLDLLVSASVVGRSLTFLIFHYRILVIYYALPKPKYSFPYIASDFP